MLPLLVSENVYVFLGNEMGEPVIEEREIRISDKPLNKSRGRKLDCGQGFDVKVVPKL